MPSRLELSPFISLPPEPDGELLFPSPWEFGSDSAGGDENHWDYDISIHCESSISIENPESLREYCGLSKDSVLGLFAEWTTSLTNHARGRGPEVRLKLDGSSPIEKKIELTIPGKRAGGTISIERFLVLLEPSGASAQEPSIPGSILWKDSTDKELEGRGSRLPVTVVKFSNFPERFSNPKATWEIHTAPDALHRPPSTGLRIFLNEDHERLVDLVTSDSDSYEAVVATEMLKLDVGRQLLTRALRDDLFCDSNYDGYDEGSLGSSLRMRASNLFPNSSLSEVRSVFESEPKRFEGQLQEHLMNLAQVGG